MAPIVPAFLFGFHLVLLVLFLNPRLALTGEGAIRLALVVVPLTTVAGALGAALSWRRHGDRMLRAVPWWLAGELVTVALIYGIHASVLGFGLHPGVARRLVKAAISLALFALIVFYTALLHSLTRRRYGLRSQALLVAVTLASVWVAIERRESLRLAPVPEPPTSAIVRSEQSLVVLWLEGASLEQVLPLAERGELPFFATALREGAFGAVELIRPVDRTVQLGAALTGKYPFRSGLVSSSVWQLPRSSEHLDLAPLPRRIPWLRWVGFEASPRPFSGLPFWEVWTGLAPSETRLLGLEGGSRGAIEVSLDADREIERSWWEAAGQSALTMVRLRALDTPSTELVTSGRDLEPPAAHTGASATHLRAVDSLLAAHWSRRQPTENWVVLSTASRHQPRRPWRLAEADLDDGFVLLFGPAVERGRIARSVRPIDLAPTILYLSGYPSARDLDGRVRTDLLNASWRRDRPLAFVPSYDFLARRKP